MMKLRNPLPSITKIVVVLALISTVAEAQTRRLHLVRDGTSAKVSLSSTMINTQATLRDVEGEFNLDPVSIERSTFTLRTSLSNVQFASMPVEQMIIIQSLIGSVPNKNVSFSTSSIQKVNATRLIVLGVAESGGRREKLAIPLDIVQVGETLSKFRGSFKKNFSGNNESPQLALLGNVSCDGDFVLEFRG